MGDTFGKIFRVTTWGESHGPAVGVVIEGCVPLLPLDLEESSLKILDASGRPSGVRAFTSAEIQRELDRRRPGQTSLTTPRKESDLAYILSGVFEGKTTGAPLCALSWNSDVKSEDYD